MAKTILAEKQSKKYRQIREYIGPYLPYDLQGIVNFENKHWIPKGQQITIHFTAIDEVIMGRIKPILKPLSDLTNEIKTKFPNAPNFKNILRNWEYWCKTDLLKTNIEYCVIKLLFKNHYDVSKLIEKGLAIDINTLKK